MLGYGLSQLSEEEIQHRRNLLDLYSIIAQLSSLAVFLSFPLYVLAKRGFSRVLALFYFRGKETGFSGRLRSIQWWLDSRCFTNAVTRGELIFVIFWLAWLLFLCTHRTGNDFLHLTKRLGTVGASQLPLQYVLGRHSIHRSLTSIIRLPHSRPIGLHKLLGIIIFILLSLHSSLYIYYFLRTGVLPTRIRETDVISGLSSCVLFSILTVSTLRLVSNWNYRVFYTIHVLFSSVVVLVLFFHTRHVRTILFQILIIRLLDELLRYYRTRIFCGSVTLVPSTNLVQIVIPLIWWEDTWTFNLGEHVIVSRPPLGTSMGWTNALSARYRANPFTIASIPERDGKLILISRTRHGNTKRLSDIARLVSLETSPRISPHIPLTAEGPYPTNLATADIQKFSHVIIVAGGVGATFGFPVFRSLSYSTKNGRAMHAPIQRVRFVWAVRKLAEASWAFSDDFTELERQRAQETGHRVELHVTGYAHGENEAADTALLDEMELAEGELGWDEKLLRQYRETGVVSRGRPCLSEIVGEVFADNSDGNLALLVCGPKGMVSELRNQAEYWRTKGRHVYWHAEQFSG